MRTYLDAKLMARALRSALEQQDIAISHSQALEVVAAQFECPDWNVLAATIQAARAPSTFERVSPSLRSFDEGKGILSRLSRIPSGLGASLRGEVSPLCASLTRGVDPSSERTSW